MSWLRRKLRSLRRRKEVKTRCPFCGIIIGHTIVSTKDESVVHDNVSYNNFGGTIMIESGTHKRIRGVCNTCFENFGSLRRWKIVATSIFGRR